MEHTGRDQNAESVVDEGEEQVLTNIAYHRPQETPHPDDAGQVALEQRDARALRRSTSSFCRSLGFRESGNQPCSFAKAAISAPPAT